MNSNPPDNPVERPPVFLDRIENAPAGRALPRLLLLHFALAAYGLSFDTLWVDEAYSALMARRSVPEILHAMRFDAGPPLYYIVLSAWRAVAGESEAALRMLSLLFSMLATGLIYTTGAALMGTRTAFWAALFWTVSPLSLYYAHEARHYAMLACLALGAVRLFLRFRETRSPAALAGLACVSAAGVYTHNLYWFVLPGLAAAALLPGPDRAALAGAAAAMGSAAIACIPWIPTLLAQMEQTERIIGWLDNAWTPGVIGLTFSTYVPGGRTWFVLGLAAAPPPLRLINGMGVAALTLFGAYRVFRAGLRTAAAPVCVLVIGLLGPYIASLAFNPVYIPGRTDFHLYPLFLLFLASGAASIRPARWRALVGGVLAVQMFAFCLTQYIPGPRISERDAVQYLRRNLDSGDAVLSTGLTRPFLEYYLPSAKLVSYPSDMETHLAHLNEQWYAENLNLETEAAECATAAAETVGEGGEVYLMGSGRRVNGPLFEAMNRAPGLRKRTRIQTESMGLRVLGEPLFIDVYAYEPGS